MDERFVFDETRHCKYNLEKDRFHCNNEKEFSSRTVQKMVAW